MLGSARAFGSFSVDDIDRARTFYSEVLGVEVRDAPQGFRLALAGGGEFLVYPKPNHAAATFTVLNFFVDDVDAAVDELTRRGVTFERYDTETIRTDARGVFRGGGDQPHPSIAWFADPAGNILAIIGRPPHRG